jgi:hypothetical protein
MQLVRIVTLAAIVVAAAYPAAASARAWTVVSGAPLHQPALDAVTAVPGSGEVWAAGTYGAAITPIFERERGRSWTAVAAARSGPGTLLSGMGAVGRNDVWAVGRRAAGSSVRTLAEHWNGADWSVVPTPDVGANAGFLAVAAGPHGVWAVGYTGPRSLIERWDGAAWRVERAPALPDALLVDVTVVPGSADVWAVGTRVLPDGESVTLTERRRGGRWHLVRSPDGPAAGGLPASGLGTVAAVSRRDVWAAGASAAGGLLEHWDGHAWLVRPGLPADANATAAVHVPGTSAVWIVGAQGVGAESQATFTARLHHGRMHVVPSPNPDLGCEYNDVLTGVAAGAGTVWAVGYHTHLLAGCGDTVQGSLILRY